MVVLGGDGRVNSIAQVGLPSCRGPAAFKPHLPRFQRSVVRRAASDGGGDDELDKLKQRFFKEDSQGQSAAKPSSSQPSLNDINPYVLGQRARQTVDKMWDQFASIAQPTRSFVFDDVMDASMDFGDDLDENERRTVLVVGATGRVGRILVRKLLLRGFKVRALVRKREGIRDDADGAVPAAVELVEGDVGEARDCNAAVRSVDKVIFCAAARTSFTGDLLRVEDRGVLNLVKAMQDELHRRALKSGSRYSHTSKREVADFSRAYHRLRWDVEFVGVQGDDGKLSRDFARANLATAQTNEEKNLVFEGALFTRNAIAEVGAEVSSTLPGGGARIGGTEGLTLRVRGDGKQYACVLSTGAGQRYVARFPTRAGSFLVVRLPFAVFRPETEGLPPMAPEAISHIALRYELRRPMSVASTAGAAKMPAGSVGTLEAATQRNLRFKLEVDWIKALPGGTEPTFVMLSCAGTASKGADPAETAKRVASKRRGEDHLRSSGLGYTIIRPGALVDEPGGYKALVFDQGDRISQNVSCADVADICLRALSEPEARNKTFDVAYEYQPDEGLQVYELVASIPKPAATSGSNYLAPALATLQKNT